MFEKLYLEVSKMLCCFIKEKAVNSRLGGDD